jgi:hypothetical protein
MSVIQRPTKQGNATTYQGKVAAGYTTILASEVDADLDLIYSAWNQGIDTINIKDGSITGSKLAAGAVGTRELTDGGIQTVDIGDGQITTAKIADLQVTTGKLALGAAGDAQISGVAWTKLIAPLLAQMGLTPRMQLSAGATYAEVEVNLSGMPQYDASKPSWLVRLDYTGDNFEVWRAPAGTSNFAKLFSIAGYGRTICNLADLSVLRNQIAINAVGGAFAYVANPTGFSLSTPNVWTTYATLPSLTTRGGYVHLYAAPSLSVSIPSPGTGGLAQSRWIRDGALVVSNSPLVALASLEYVPLPGITWIDNGAAAGSHIYAYQVAVPPGGTMISSNVVDGGFQAHEIG